MPTIRTIKQGRYYNKYVFVLHVDNGIVRLERKEPRAETKIFDVTFYEKNYFIFSPSVNKIQFKGRAKDILNQAKGIKGYTYKLDEALKPLGFKWSHSRSMFIPREVVAA